MKLEPLYDRLVVRRISPDSVSAGGILLVDPEEQGIGEVLSVGTGRIADNGTTWPLRVQTGNRVLFGKYSGTTVKVENEDLVVLREEDVLAIVLD